MAYLDNIEDMYKKMYEARDKKALTDKETAISGINTQKGKIDNDYLKLQNDLGTAKKTKEAEYQGLYTSLDNQSQEGKDMYYQDRNSASVQNVQKVQAIKDYMARNNLMSSGENVDAMLRSNTDYNNNLGNIYSNEKKFVKGIEDNRNAYKLQEQNAYNTIDNQLSTAQNNYTLDLADIAEKTRLAEDGYINSMAAYQDELDAQKLNDINNYNLQQQQIASSRRSSGGSSRSSDSAALKAQQDASKQEYTVYNDAIDNIDSLYAYKDSESGQMKVGNPDALRKYIIGLGLSDSYTDKLLLRYGLPTNIDSTPINYYGSNEKASRSNALW